MNFNYRSCPIWFELVGKDRRYSEEDGGGVRQSKDLQDQARLRKQGDKATERNIPNGVKKSRKKKRPTIALALKSDRRANA